MQIPAGLKEKLNNIPQLPGIYKMLDARGNIIYVGKSKHLRNRVKSYFSGTKQWSKIERLVSLIHDVEYEVTDTHLEARLLECSLIKTLKPEFNAQMKNDRRYVYLKVEKYNSYNALTVVRERSEFSYGSFRNKYRLMGIIDGLSSIFPIIKSNGSYDFDYHAIPLSMDKEAFDINRSSLIGVLSDRGCMNSLISTMERKMKEAAIACRFETAGKYRDMIQGLNYLSYRLNLYSGFVEKDFLLKIPVPGGVKLFFISKGNILHNESFNALTDSVINAFLEKARTIKHELTSNNDIISGTGKRVIIDEKADKDFKDILYSEISSLPKAYVVLIG